jgi:hypothetical protein
VGICAIELADGSVAMSRDLRPDMVVCWSEGEPLMSKLMVSYVTMASSAFCMILFYRREFGFAH